MSRPRARRLTSAFAASVLVTGGALAIGAAPATAAPMSVPFTFVAPTGGTPDPFQTWQVPAGVTQITVVAEAAAGAAGVSGTGSGAVGGVGGPGARVTTSISVTPLETLRIRVGGAGSGPSGGYNGGGAGGDGTSSDGGAGGGASDVRRTPYATADRLVTAGGGGGGGADDGGVPGDGGPGGSGGQTGATGGSSLCAVGGAGGANADGIGSPGGGGGFDGGGGGGGGAGGGGGGSSCGDPTQAGAGGGGGGSSSVVGPIGTPVYEDGVTTGNGSVTITYEVPPPSRPGAPTEVKVGASASGTANVSFVPPVDQGSSPVTAYQASCGGVNKGGFGSPIAVTGLPNGVAITCKVRARNATGFGPFSAEVPFTPGVPWGPTSVTGGPGPVTGSVVVNWNAAQTNGAPIQRYVVTCVPWNPSFPTRSVEVGGAKRTLQVNGLQPGQAHNCSIVASNSRGPGNPRDAQPVGLVKAKS